MAEENTTDSTQTTTTSTDNLSAAASTDTSSTDQASQTDQSQQNEGESEGGASEGTILTSDQTDAEKDAAADGTGEKSEAAPNEFFGAPEGEYQLEGLPEGTVIDEKALEAVAPVAKEMGLSNAGLSKIAGVYAEKVLPLVVENFTDQLQRDVAAQHAEWAKEATEAVKTDPVFSGRPLPEVQQIAAKAIDRFGGEEFRKFLNDTGLGNHPGMVKWAYLTGTAISEDTTFERGDHSPKPKSAVEKFYGPQS